MFASSYGRTARKFRLAWRWTEHLLCNISYDHLFSCFERGGATFIYHKGVSGKGPGLLVYRPDNVSLHKGP